MRRELLVASLLVVAAPAESAEIWNESINQWHVGAYDADKTFSHCAAIAKYKSGHNLLFSVSRTLSWSMGVANLNWSLRPGTKYRIAYWVDSHAPELSEAVARSKVMAEANLEATAELFNKFRRGRTLHIKADGTSFGFNLTDTNRVLTYLLDCAKGGGQKPMLAALPPKREPARTVIAPHREIAAMRNEAMIFAANLVSELGLSGVKFISPDEVPSGFKGDAVWRTSKSLGAVTILENVSDGTTIPPALISIDAKSCKQAFASGSLPPEAGSTLSRLFTKCGLGEKSLVIYYLILPRKLGGHYVIGSASIGEEEAARSTDEKVSTAVFKALPR